MRSLPGAHSTIFSFQFNSVQFGCRCFIVLSTLHQHIKPYNARVAHTLVGWCTVFIICAGSQKNALQMHLITARGALPLRLAFVFCQRLFTVQHTAHADRRNQRPFELAPGRGLTYPHRAFTSPSPPRPGRRPPCPRRPASPRARAYLRRTAAGTLQPAAPPARSRRQAARRSCRRVGAAA